MGVEPAADSSSAMATDGWKASGPIMVAMDLTLTPVAYVKDGRLDTEDDYWGGRMCRIQLTDDYDENSLAGLDGFSHLEVVFVFDRVDSDTVETTARHPRGRQDWPLVGIFGQRGKRRPNRLGVSRCSLVGIEGKTLIVTEFDAIEGTPVLDIKPWMAEFGPRGEVRQPGWATELMADYYKDSPASDTDRVTRC